MIKNITCETVDKIAIIEPHPSSHDSIRISYGYKGEGGAGSGVEIICTCSIADVWQMIMDHLITEDVSPAGSPVLYRLKCEVLAVLNHRHSINLRRY